MKLNKLERLCTHFIRVVIMMYCYYNMALLQNAYRIQKCEVFTFCMFRRPPLFLKALFFSLFKMIISLTIIVLLYI